MKKGLQKVTAILVGGAIFITMATPLLAVDATGTAGVRQVFKNTLARLSGGTVTAVDSDSLTVASAGKMITVNWTAGTKLRRKFWGTALISEIASGDSVNVWGKWSDDTQTTINATLIRDTSIQKQNGVFVGTVSSASASAWMVNTFNRGAQVLTVSTTTKFTDRNGRTVSQADVAVGNRVRIRGLWDSKANTITEVTTVKDYSLPVKIAPTTSSASATPQ